MAGLHPRLEPFADSSDDTFDRVKAAHLFNRAAFGGTPEEITHAVEQGLTKTVDALLDFPDANADELSPTEVPDLSSIEGYPRTYADRKKLYEGKTPEERMLIQQRLNAANRDAVNTTARWWLDRMADCQYPLQEKLTFLWHGHFTTSARDERSAWLMWQQNELLRRNAAGNFRDFVKAVSHDPAMLDYLNNSQNRKNAPNENYARELLELFTLGIGNYTEKDIKEAARAFTGWAHDGEEFIFRKFDHDNEPKTFFGVRGNFDGNDVVDVVTKQPACSLYVANRLMRWFVSETPDPAVQKGLAELVRESNYDLRPVLRTLLLSRAFFDSNVIGGQIKSPVQLVVSTLRNLDVAVPDYRRLRNALEQMGQTPFDPPNVKGWPGGRAWINTSTLFVRYNTCLWLAGGKPISTGKPLRDRAQRRRGMPQPKGLPDALAMSPEELVNAWLDRLIQRPVPRDRSALLVDRVGPKVTKDSQRDVVQAIMSMPEYQLC